MPSLASMSIKVSMLKRSIRPRMRSLTRGWVTPRSSAASPCFRRRAAIAFWRLSISSERTLRCRASSGGKPRSRNTFPVDRVSFTFLTDHLSLSPRSPLEQQAQAMPGEIEVILRCPSRPLLERVKNVDRLGELGDVEDAVLCTRVDADLLDARPDARHRFPIVRLQAALHSPGAGIRRSAWRRLESGPLYKNLDVASTPDRKSTRLNSSHGYISYAVFCLKKKK